MVPRLRTPLLLLFGLLACGAPPIANTPPSPQPTPDSATVAVIPVSAAEPGRSATGPSGGELSVQVDHGWGEIWVDGKRLLEGSQLNTWPLKTGRHTLRIVQPTGGQLIADTTVDIGADCMTIVIVDAKGGTHNTRYYNNWTDEDIDDLSSCHPIQPSVRK